MWSKKYSKLSENMVERIVAVEDRETITASSLPDELLNPGQNTDQQFNIGSGFNLNETLDEIASDYVKQALQKTNGNLRESAGLLGINYRSLRYLIEKYDLKSIRDANQRGPWGQ